MVEARIVINRILLLPEEMKKRYNIAEIPSPVIVDGTEYREDAVPFPLEEFSAMLLSGKHTIETAASAPMEYAAVFKETDPEVPIFVFCLSTKISAFYKSAVSAAEEAGGKNVHVIDTRVCPPAPTLAALAAAEAARECENEEELVKRVEEIVKGVKLYWALFSLEYLHQTGRISGARAFLGKMLKIVPLITTDQEGFIVPAGKTRRLENSLDRITEFIDKDLREKAGSTLDVLIAYTGREDNARMLEEKVKERFEVRRSFFFKGGYSTHRYVGPDAAGVAYIVS